MSRTHWLQDPYIGKLVEKKQEKIRRQISDGTYAGFCQVITLALNGKDYLDIRPARSLQKEYVKETDPLLVGLAGTSREARKLVEKMAQDCWKARGDADLRRYFLGKETE